MNLIRKIDHHLLRLAVPVVSSQLGLMAMQLVDTAFLGRVGADALSSAAISGTVFIIILVFWTGLAFGLDFWVSTSFGAKDFDRARHFLGQSILQMTLVSIPSILLMFFLPMTLSVFSLTPNVAADASQYLKIISSSLWFGLIYTVFRQYLQAFHQVRAMVVLMVLANILNFFLDWILVLGILGLPGLGVVGAAWATWISRLVLMIGAWVLVRQSLYARNESLFLHKIRFDKKAQWNLVRLGLPSAGHMLLEVGAFGGSTLIAARFGSVAIAAHQITLQIASLTFMVPLGISQAGSVWVGNSIGARVWSRARAFAFRTVNTAAVFMSISGITMWFFGEYWLRLFTNSETVIEMGLPLLRLAALFQLWDGIQISTSGVLRGMQDTRSSMIANAIGHWVIGLPLGAYFAFYRGYDVRGLWMGLSFGLFLVAVGLYVRLRYQVKLLNELKFL